MIQHAERLQGIHPDLARVVRRASESCPVALMVLEGLRTVERERKLIAAGASALKDPLRCRHVTGHAVDLGAMLDFDGDGDLDLRWDWPLYAKIATAMKAAAAELLVPIEWGGDWESFKDGTHFQLPWKQYPVKEA